MHEGSKRRRGDRAEGWKDLHNRAISLSIWSCVYNLPLLLLNADLSACLTDPVPRHHPPEQSSSNNITLYLQSAQSLCRTRVSLSVHFSVRF